MAQSLKDEKMMDIDSKDAPPSEKSTKENAIIVLSGMDDFKFALAFI